MSRTADVDRTTKETAVRVRLDLDGVGRTKIATGVGFFDHMLEQLGRHSGIDLEIDAEGDLTVDSHHIVEGVFKAVAKALRIAVELDPRAGGEIPSTKGVL